MGLAAFRLLSVGRGAPARIPGRATRCAGAHVYAEAGQRVFVDLTGALRGSVGRALIPRMLDVMEARSAAILRRLFDDPRLSADAALAAVVPAPRAAHRAHDTGCRCTRGRGPGAAGTRRAPARTGSGAELAARLAAARKRDRRRAARLRRARARPARSSRSGPRLLPAAAAGLGMLGLAGRLLGEDAQPADLQTVLRGLPAQRHHRDGPRAVDAGQRDPGGRGRRARAARRSRPAELARRFHAGTLPAGGAARARRVPVPVRPPRGGGDRHRHAALVRRPDPHPRRARQLPPPGRPGAGAGRGLRPRRGGGGGHDRDAGRPRARGAAGCARAWCASPSTGRGSSRGCASCRSTTWSSPSRRCVGNWPRSAPSWPAAGPSRPADDVFFLDLVEARAASRRAATCAPLVDARRQAYAAELRRRHVPRVLLSDGTEPEAESLAARPPPTARSSARAASAGAVTGIGARHPRSGRRAPRAGRDPGRAVHRPGLDAAVPDRRRAGDGDGRRQLARRGGRARVRHPGRGRRRRRHRSGSRTGQRIRVDGTAGVVLTEVRSIS